MFYASCSHQGSNEDCQNYFNISDHHTYCFGVVLCKCQERSWLLKWNESTNTIILCTDPPHFIHSKYTSPVGLTPDLNTKKPDIVFVMKKISQVVHYPEWDHRGLRDGEILTPIDITACKALHCFKQLAQ